MSPTPVADRIHMRVILGLSLRNRLAEQQQYYRNERQTTISCVLDTQTTKTSIGSSSHEECLTLLGAGREGAPMRVPTKREKRRGNIARKVKKKTAEKTAMTKCRKLGGNDGIQIKAHSRYGIH